MVMADHDEDFEHLLPLAADTRTAIRSGVHMMRLLHGHTEITPSQLATLNTLVEGPKPVTLLAKLKDVSQPTMSQHLNRLADLLSLIHI